MAQKTIVTLIDDLTGEEAEDISTVEFSLDGATYEIDLDDKNSAALRDVLAEYVAAARRTGGRRTNGGGRRRTADNGAPKAAASGGYDRETSKQIRTWAKEQGYEVSERGRVPHNVIQAWEAQGNSGESGPGAGHAATFSG